MSSYVVITSDIFFLAGVSNLIKELDTDNEIIHLSMDDFSILPFYNNHRKYIFVIYLHNVRSTFILLSLLEAVGSKVVIFPKNDKIVKTCLYFGVNYTDIESIDHALATLKNPISLTFTKRNRLTQQENSVIIDLLRGRKISDIAYNTGRAYKTISSHKRNALLKLGVNNINFFADNINEEVLNVLSRC